MKKAFIITIAVIVFALMGYMRVTKVQAQNASGQNMSVFPAIQEKQVKPGETTRVQIQFKNGGSTALPGTLKVVDFVVADKEGTPKIVEDAKLTSKYGASSWIDLPSPYLVIPARDYVSVDLGITVPTDVTTCSKYALVYFEPTNIALDTLDTDTQPKSATQVTSRLGGIITFNIENSNCKENLSLSGFSLPHFQEYGPIKVNFDIFNLSDYHISPAGYVNVTNLFGLPVAQKTIQQQRIFPEAAKTYALELGHKWMIGRYKVTVNSASNGIKSVNRTETAYVWVFPWKMALVFILAVLIAGLLIKNLYVKISKKEEVLESEIAREKAEIEKLKQQLRKKNE